MENITNKSTQFLISNNINTLPYDFKDIAIKNHCILLQYETHKEFAKRIDKKKIRIKNISWTICYNGYNFIFYSGKKSNKKVRYCIALEFGHIILRDAKLSRIDYIDGTARFAEQILMPICVLKKCNILTALRISESCNTPLSTAKSALKNYRKSITSCNTNVELKIINQFSYYINNYKK